MKIPIKFNYSRQDFCWKKVHGKCIVAFRFESISFWRHLGEIKGISNNLLSVLEKLSHMMLAPREKGLHL
jgi:hypothetical protein